MVRGFARHLAALDPTCQIPATDLLVSSWLVRTTLIARIPASHRYQLTDSGLRTAMFLTRNNDRLLRSCLAQLSRPVPGPVPAGLRRAADAYQTALDDLAHDCGLAA